MSEGYLKIFVGLSLLFVNSLIIKYLKNLKETSTHINESMLFCFLFQVGNIYLIDK
jgi:hypothetical protein